MRLAVVTTSYPSRPDDPAGHFVHADVQVLRAEGHQVSVLAPRHPDREPGELDDVIELPHGGLYGWPGATARLTEQPLRAMGAPIWLRAVRQALRREKPDEVIVHWALPNAWAVPSGVPTRMVSHGADVRLLERLPPLFAARLLWNAVEWRFVAPHLLCAVRAMLVGKDVHHFDRIAHVAPSAVAPIVVDEALRIKLRAKYRGPVFVIVGRLVRAKGVMRAIDHFIAHCAHGKAGSLVIVGDGPERPELERRARGYRVHFTGMLARTEAVTWIAAADELWIASREEGAPTVVREAETVGTSIRWIDLSPT